MHGQPGRPRGTYMREYKDAGGHRHYTTVLWRDLIPSRLNRANTSVLCLVALYARSHFALGIGCVTQFFNSGAFASYRVTR